MYIHIYTRLYVNIEEKYIWLDSILYVIRLYLRYILLITSLSLARPFCHFQLIDPIWIISVFIRACEHHWFPLIKPKIKALFLRGARVCGGAGLTSDDVRSSFLLGFFVAPPSRQSSKFFPENFQKNSVEKSRKENKTTSGNQKW